MKLIRVVIILALIILILAVIAQYVVKEFASEKIADTIREALEAGTSKQATFDDLEIDLFNSTIEISNFTMPLPSGESGEGGGQISVGNAVINFAMQDAASMLTSSKTITEGTIRLEYPELTLSSTLPIETKAAAVEIDFRGNLEIDEDGPVDPLALADMLEDNQEITIRMQELELTVPDGKRLMAIIDTMKNRTSPVSGFEIAMISTILLPDIPLVREISQGATSSNIAIDPEQFFRLVELGTQFLGIDSTDTMVSDAFLNIENNGNSKLSLTGNMINDIGNISITGLGNLTGDITASGGTIDALTIEITNLNSDLAEVLQKDSLVITLDAPVALQELMKGYYSFQ